METVQLHAPTFEGAVAQFQDFLGSHDWRTAVHWCDRSDLIPWSLGLTLVRSTARRPVCVRARYEEGRERGLCVLLSARCVVDDSTYATVYWTDDPIEAEYRWLSVPGLKLQCPMPLTQGRLVGGLAWRLARWRRRAWLR